MATIIYAVGWTSIVSDRKLFGTAAMLQLLLGNVGRAGGGVNALRGPLQLSKAPPTWPAIFDNLPAT